MAMSGHSNGPGLQVPKRLALRSRLVFVAAFAPALGVKLRLLNFFEEIRVEHGRRHSVLAGRPLAKINQATTSGTKGEVFVR
jgi:hypothetical protein